MIKVRQLMIVLVWTLLVVTTGSGLAFRSLEERPLSPGRLPAEATVAEVIDGDTVVLASGEKVRYLGINAPEMSVLKGKTWISRPQPFGREATAFNEGLVEGKIVQLEYEARTRDDYGRLLAYVTAEERFINGELVKQGLALVDVRKPNFKHQRALMALQEEARSQERGIWGADDALRIEADDAFRHRDALALVHGTVSQVRFSSDRALLCFGEDPRKGFTALIYREHFTLFGPNARDRIDSLQNKEVQICGFIKGSSGPTMFVCVPSQIEILGKQEQY